MNYIQLKWFVVTISPRISSFKCKFYLTFINKISYLPFHKKLL